MVENYSNASSMEDIDLINVLMHNYKNFFTKRCRTCSSVLKDNVCTDSFELNAKETSLRDKLYSCCPEFDLRSNTKTILCINCSQIINIIYEFNRKYDKSKGLPHSNFSISLPFISNSFGITVKNEIKTEEVDLSDTEISLNLHKQIQSIKKSQKCLQNNMKTTECLVEGSSKHSQSNDAIYEHVSKKSPSLPTEEETPKYSYHNDGSYSIDTLIKHYRTHTRGKPFKCPQCDYRCTRKERLSSHFRTHTGEKPFKCLQCDYRTAHKYYLKSHVDTHTGDKPFQCFQCDFRTAHKKDLVAHFRRHTFKCIHCNYSSATKISLVNHFRIHMGDKPFQCSQCDFRAAQKSILVRHFRRHSGDKPFKCSECDFRAAQKNILVRHFRRHTGDKPFKCSQCDYSAARKSSLVIHNYTHCGNKPFKCAKCNYSTTRKSDLKNHFRSHTVDKRFKCSKCDYSCNQKGHLTCHFRNSH